MTPDSTGNGERWRQLCKRASREQDARKLLELTREINRLLDEKTNTVVREGYRPADASNSGLRESL